MRATPARRSGKSCWASRGGSYPPRRAPDRSGVAPEIRSGARTEEGAGEGDDGAPDEIRVEAIAHLGLVGDDPVHQHRGGEAELLDVEVGIGLAACDGLAQEHRGKGANLVASATEHVSQGGLDV